jgi:hypothetical protein
MERRNRGAAKVKDDVRQIGTKLNELLTFSDPWRCQAPQIGLDSRRPGPLSIRSQMADPPSCDGPAAGHDRW